MSEETAVIHSDLSEIKTTLYGNALRGKRGLVDKVDGIEEIVREVAVSSQGIQGALDKLLPMIQELKDHDVARARNESRIRSNALSKVFQDIAVILTVITFCTPILISDLRRPLFGENELVWAIVLIGSIAFFSFASIITRKNGEGHK